MSKTLLTLLGCAAMAVAQDRTLPLMQHSTLAPADARYEIVMDVTGTRDFVTLRLDRYTGHVARLVNSSVGKTWQEMDVPGLPPASVLEPRFQLTHMSFNANSLYLLDTMKGQAWALEPQDPNDATSARVWKPFVVPSP